MVMAPEQWSFVLALALMPLALFLLMCLLALARVAIARFLPDCRITRLLLVRVDHAGYGQSGGSSVGSGRGKLWAELTQEFRALYK